MENRLLAALPREALEELRPHFERVSLSHSQHVIVPDEPIRDRYFPLNCLLSMVTTMENGGTVESGCVGREGMSGVPVLLDAGRTTMPAFAQVPGDAFKKAYDESTGVRRLLNRIHMVIVNGSHAAACNRLHRLDERFCKWLLMCCDGVGSDEVDLTHEFLSTMHGVRRVGVSVSASKLQDLGLIRNDRARIHILDREGLESFTCKCYKVVRREFDRLLAA